MNKNNSGIQKKSSNGSKNKYQTRNSQRKTIIENGDSSIKYLFDQLFKKIKNTGNVRFANLDFNYLYD